MGTDAEQDKTGWKAGEGEHSPAEPIRADQDYGASLRLGSHLSITKGLDQAAALANRIGANTFQYFTRNPRGGAARQIGTDEIARWEMARREYDIFPVVGHLPYTVNLAAAGGQPQAFAQMVLSEDMRRVGAIGGELLVSHPGRHAGDREAALHQVAALLEEVLGGLSGPQPVFCLETMALQGHEIGSLEDLGYVMRFLGHPSYLGVCLDSAHLFAAGYDLRTPGGCDQLVEELERSVGLPHVKCIHLNDSLVPLGSHKDRHANLGRGELGEAGLASILHHPFLSRLPLILETPVVKYEDYGPEIAYARGLAGH